MTGRPLLEQLLAERFGEVPLTPTQVNRARRAERIRRERAAAQALRWERQASQRRLAARLRAAVTR